MEPDRRKFIDAGLTASSLMIAAVKKVFGWNDRDAIVVPNFGCNLVEETIVSNGLIPVFAEADMKTGNIDTNKLEQRLIDEMVVPTRDTINHPIRAILVCPVFDTLPNFNRLTCISKTFKVPLLLDRCPSPKIQYRNKYLTEYCLASAFSTGLIHSENLGIFEFFFVDRTG